MRFAASLLNNRGTNLIILILFGISLFSFAQDEAAPKLDEAKGIEPGSIVSDFQALDADSNVFSLSAALEQGPVVLIFYRGFWCPVCNRHLGKVQDSLELLEDKGAKVIAVSPENPEYLGEMEERSGAEFTLLYDEGYRIANAFGVNFKPSKATLFTYNVFGGANMKESHSEDSFQLPIPATYLISPDSRVIWRHVNPDYKERASVSQILNALAKYRKN